MSRLLLLIEVRRGLLPFSRRREVLLLLAHAVLENFGPRVGVRESVAPAHA
ncbi:MAG: hypothetical protein ACJ8DC_09790 [Gemmatimonadales bacterium]